MSLPNPTVMSRPILRPPITCKGVTAKSMWLRAYEHAFVECLGELALAIQLEDQAAAHDRLAELREMYHMALHEPVAALAA